MQKDCFRLKTCLIFFISFLKLLNKKEEFMNSMQDQSQIVLILITKRHFVNSKRNKTIIKLIVIVSCLISDNCLNNSLGTS